jgi:ribosomal-protein-alanine N-acetyltransferase
MLRQRRVQDAARAMVEPYVKPDYRVAQVTIRDVHAIRRLEQIVFPQDAYSYLSLTTLLLTPGGAYFKAVDAAGNLVGFVAGSPDWAVHIDWIVTLGVHPNHRRYGLGNRLLTVCEENLGQPKIRLTVRASNDPAIRLYEKAAYERLYVEPHYYNDGEDGIVMQKIKHRHGYM